MKRPFYNAIHSLFCNPYHFVAAIIVRLSFLFSDETYVRLIYYFSFHHKINLDNPQTYNEKLQWLKLNYHNPLWTTLADKVAVKDYVAKLIGKEYVIPTLAVWDNIETINFNELPKQFVMKTNHDGGNNGVFVCKDKAKVDLKKVCKKMTESLHRNTYLLGREWPYKDIPRKVFAEQYIDDASGELKDYKFFCFNGTVKYLFVATGRQSGKEVMFNYYDADFNLLNLRQQHPMSDKPIAKPVNFEEMKRIASVLSQGIPEVRVDLYDANGRIYFGEYTFFHHGGVVPFHPKDWDEIWGKEIELPDKM